MAGGLWDTGNVSYRQVVNPARLHSLIDAILLIEADIDLDVLLQHIVRTASELVRAKYGALGVLSPDGDELERFITWGLTADDEAVLGDKPRGHGLLGEIIRFPAPLRVDDISSHEHSTGVPAGHPHMTTFLGVPVRSGTGEVFGNLYLTDRIDGEPFSTEDEGLIEAFGRASGLVIDDHRRRREVRQVTLSAERERMARELHDTVIQRLFAVGLSLQSVSQQVDPEVERRINLAVDDLDATIKEIRTTIFEISQRGVTPDDSLRSSVLRVVNEVPARLGLPVDVSFDGPLDTMVGPECRDELIATLREALANVVRHAQAQHAVVSVAIRNGELELRVFDDGVGPQTGEGFGHGLNNMAQRAERLGGSCALEPASPRGSLLRWSAERLD